MRSARTARRTGTAVAVAVALGALLVFGAYSYGTHDHIDFFDSVVVRDAATEACAGLLPVLTEQSQDRAAQIRRGNEAIKSLTAAVASVGDDRLDADLPARAWLADWKALAEARERFAAALSTRETADFDIPQTADGFPISRRMSTAAAGSGCDEAVAGAIRP